MKSHLALYRRYRPETFGEVIGQEHVTEPLRAALAGNRVNHAYLFSGPRGCGKTTSARILARTLNCARAPVADPCGECDSCRELARGGPGSIDVIEIDAASHNGVDDARDLREKAYFSPVRDRYKVYIIDEAHMVTPQAFNALLKLVEEPPEHLRFIFATTEPEKVIATIRSRTHHYPFRLIPPRLLSSYLTTLCEQEGVAIEPAALPLVVRAGAGSARDTLSVLDQLMGGAGSAGVTYQLASGLLGYTPDTLLDEVVDAFAAGDGAAVFGVVDKVIETGQDPRRFTEDLLRRLRDLVIVAAVPGATASGLIDVSQDQGERLVAQAARFGAADLSRGADILATGLTEMRGATAPRLLLELLCARVLLPGSDDGTAGVAARLDRLERRASISGTPSPAPSAPATAPAQDRPAQRHGAVGNPVPEPASPAATPAAQPVAPPVAEPQLEPQPDTQPRSQPSPEPPARPEAPAESAPTAPEPVPVAAAGSLTLVDVRRLWPDVVEATKLRRRLAWMHLTQNSQVIGLEGDVLTLGFTNAGARDSFLSAGCDEVTRQAAIDVVGADWRIETIIAPGATADAPSPAPAAADQPAAQPVNQPVVQPVVEPVAQPADRPADRSEADSAPPPDWAAEPPVSDPETSPIGLGAAREAIQPTRAAGRESARADERARSAAADAEADPDDRVDDTAAVGEDLLARELGARMIEEIKHA